MASRIEKPRLLKEKEAANILNVEVTTLRRWRWAGKGPAFRKLEGAVRYGPTDLDAYITSIRPTSTSDTGEGAA
jgi:predicted site-specific integrase-resolvase